MRSYRTIVQLIAATTTDSGLRVRAELDQNKYPKGIKVTDAELAAVNLSPHSFHGDWNYTISPKQRTVPRRSSIDRVIYGQALTLHPNPATAGSIRTPVLVFDDAEAAARALAANKLCNAVQVCISLTRFFVQAGIHDRFLSELVSAFETVRVGDGLNDGTQMGPLCHAGRVTATEKLVADARKRRRSADRGQADRQCRQLLRAHDRAHAR